MTRRTLALLAAAPFMMGQSPRPALLKPKQLKAGDTVALITPSTETNEPETLRVAEETCVFFGLKPIRMPNVGRRQVNFRESVRNRLFDLHEAFRNPEVRGVFCVRGGYGAQHLLDSIDYDLIRQNPKVFLGYSDITALHLAIGARTGLVTFHGPVPVSAFTKYTQDHFTRAIFGQAPLGDVTNPPLSDPLRPRHRLRTLRSGQASGPLVGGNLSLILATMGTPYEIQTKDAILVLEDVGEQVYAIDRMLMNLRLSKKLQQAAGLVWGECSDCPPDGKPNTTSPYGLSETIENLLSDLNIPVLSGLTIGHTADQLTLPLGVQATLDATAQKLTITESAYS